MQHDFPQRSTVPGTERRLSFLIGSAAAGLAFRRGPGAGLLGLASGLLLYRGISGSCPLYAHLGARGAQTLHTRLFVLAEPEQAFRYWRNLQNLPRFIPEVRHLESDRDQAHWAGRLPPLGMVRWDAQLTRAEPRHIAWRSSSDSDIQHSGEVTLRPGPDGHNSTDCEIRLEYRFTRPLHQLLAQLLGDPQRQFDAELSRIREGMERAPHAPRPRRNVDDQGLGREPGAPTHG